MTMTQEKTYQELIEHVKVACDPASQDWIESIRGKAYERFQELGFPTRKLEAWKYTNISKVLDAPFFPSNKSAFEVPDVDLLNSYHLAQEELNRLTFVNGVLNTTLSTRLDLPKNVTVEDLATTLKSHPDRIKKYLARDIQDERNAFAAINSFSFNHGLFIHIPKGVQVEAPIHLLVAGMGDSHWPLVYYPRTLIVLEDDAQLTLVSDHVSLNDEPYFVNVVQEVHLGKGAKLHWAAIQRQSSKASLFKKARFYQQENSNLEVRTFVHGSEVSYKDFEVNLEGKNATCDVRGLSLLEGNSQVSQRIWVNHKASHCTSRQVYKNILADSAQAEFNSTSFVHKDTKGSDSDQLNRNLILSNQARAFSRPQLKIDSDDVAATHGSATGQLDDKELFYLRSRGLDPAFARFILTFGFAEEILEKIAPDQTRWQLELLVRKKIEALSDPAREAKASE